MAAEIKHKREKHKSRRHWEPTEQELHMYVEWNAGKSQRRISKKFGISERMVQYTFKKMDKWFSEQYMGRIREIKANHTQRLEYIYREALSAWRRSQHDEEIVTETDKNHGQFPGTETKKTRKGQVGASEFLQAAMKALNDIREIWGANAPLEIQHTGEVRVAGRDVAEARSELLERMQKLTAAHQN